MTEQNDAAQRIWLWPGTAPGPEVQDDFRPWLDLYPVETDKPCGAVLVLPGGGYTHRASHEGEPVARLFNARGYHAFVVQYRVQPHPGSSSFLDAARSMRIVRGHATEWGIAPGQIAACGFSAGGHLAGLLGGHFDEGDPRAQDPVERFSSRPDALILCYAWLSAMDMEPNDIRVPPGEDAQQFRKRISAEQNVSDKTPPAFLWHTSDDKRVPVKHSLLFAEALRQHSVPFELHVYRQGRHGLGLAHENPHVASWVNLCCEWLDSMGWIKASRSSQPSR
jgi:acetyl esterase/lipase